MSARRPNGFLIALLLSLPASGHAGEVPGVFVLEKKDGAIALEKVPVPAGETVVLPAGPGAGVIGLVFPPGPGVSGSIEQVREGRAIVLRNLGDRLRCEVRSDGRAASGFPDRPIEDLARYDTRVSATGGDGARAVFLVRGYATATPEPGPVQNLFAGMPVPLGPQDFVVTTDTSARPSGPRITGEAALDLHGHPFVRVRGPAGREGWFILDTGAAETLVARSFLPDSARITETAMVEYSAAGKRLLDYAPSGATGPVTGVLGHVTLDRLQAGTLGFEGVEAAVVDAIPDLFDRPVSGVLGIDLLRRAASVTLEYPPGAAGAGRLRLGPPPGEAPGDVRAPFSLVSTHPVVPARFNGVEAFMILDTGAPGAVLDSAAAAAAGLAAVPAKAMRGLDGGGVESAQGTLDSLAVGAAAWSDVPCRIGPLHAFRTLRDDRPLGLLGNEVIARAGRLVIDFDRRVVTFAGTRGAP